MTSPKALRDRFIVLSFFELLAGDAGLVYPL